MLNAAVKFAMVLDSSLFLEGSWRDGLCFSLLSLLSASTYPVWMVEKMLQCTYSHAQSVHRFERVTAACCKIMLVLSFLVSPSGPIFVLHCLMCCSLWAVTPSFCCSGVACDDVGSSCLVDCNAFLKSSWNGTGVLKPTPFDKSHAYKLKHMSTVKIADCW